MEKEKLKKLKVPDAPGVYFFLGKRKEILYIGKATELSSRVKSYFDPRLRMQRSALIEKMVQEAQTLEWTVTDSVLEAMLLETNLIRTHKPEYNTRSKDDKSYNHVVITNEEFPRVLVVRGKDLLQADEATYKYIFGPFPSGLLFKEALKLVRKLFRFYDIDPTKGAQRNKVRKGKLDFNRQIGLYPESCTQEEYAKTIHHIALFFQGKKTQIITDLEKSMHAYAKREEFEKANHVKKQIFALEHIQDISLLRREHREYRDDRTMRIEGYDVAHLQGSNTVGVMVVIKSGEPSKDDYRKFIIKSHSSIDDIRSLTEILERRFTHAEWTLPNCIVVDGSAPQRNAAQKVLKRHNLTIPIVSVVKNDQHKPERLVGPSTLIREYKDAILLANHEAHRFAITFHRAKRRKNTL